MKTYWGKYRIIRKYLRRIKQGKGKVCIRAKWLIRPELIPVSVAWSDWEYFYSPLDGMVVHRRVTPSIKFAAGTHLYTWVENGTVSVKCLAQEHNTMSPTRARTQPRARTRTARSVESSALTMRPPRHPLMRIKRYFSQSQRELAIWPKNPEISNGKVIFRKFRSEIVEYPQRYSSFSVRNGTAEISLPFAKLSSFQSLISRKQLREIELQMVSAISFGWFADFGKTLTVIQRSSQLVYSDKW